MVHYRRNRLAGGTFFFTVTLADRRSHLLIERIDLLRKAMRVVQRQRPFHIDAIVVLPEHLHSIWTLPVADDDYPRRWQGIKSLFSRLVVKAGVAVPRSNQGGYRLWQARYWEHTIMDEDDYQRHMDYIHYNPVKHGWVKRVVN